MLVITLHQPWASLIALNLKKHETRTWATHHRGLLAIHAGKKKVSEEGLDIWHQALSLGKLDISDSPENLPLGKIVCVVKLSNCFLMHHQETKNCIDINGISELERLVGNWQIGRYAWELSNLISISEPVPWTGKQGLTTLDRDVEDQVIKTAYYRDF
jgi:activating signal cointegrator 1